MWFSAKSFKLENSIEMLPARGIYFIKAGTIYFVDILMQIYSISQRQKQYKSFALIKYVKCSTLTLKTYCKLTEDERGK